MSRVVVMAEPEMVVELENTVWGAEDLNSDQRGEGGDDIT